MFTYVYLATSVWAIQPLVLANMSLSTLLKTVALFNVIHVKAHDNKKLFPIVYLRHRYMNIHFNFEMIDVDSRT